jgi:hypothetical protein
MLEEKFSIGEINKKTSWKQFVPTIAMEPSYFEMAKCATG